jgi:hypothetical protein
MVGSDSTDPVPWILGFDALITVALGAAILVITWKDPSRLMLGQLTGREYESIRRLHMGDDQIGERKVVPSIQTLEIEEESELANRRSDSPTVSAPTEDEP